MTLAIRRLEASFGAEVTGIDVGAAAPDALAAVRRAIVDHQLLVLRDQRMTPQRLEAFGATWGELDVEKSHPALPEQAHVVPISNDVAHGHIDIGRYWHADGVFQRRKVRFSMLYAHRIAPMGGETLFCNAYAAAAAMPAELRAELAGKLAFHLNQERVPFIVRHPETNRETLYVNLGGMMGITGMSPMVVPSFSERVSAYLDQPTLGYTHAYRTGDLVIHDAFAVLHRATPAPQEGLRVNYRVTALVPTDYKVVAA